MDAQHILLPFMVHIGGRKPSSIVIHRDANVVLILRQMVELPRFS